MVKTIDASDHAVPRGANEGLSVRSLFAILVTVSYASEYPEHSKSFMRFIANSRSDGQATSCGFHCIMNRGFSQADYELKRDVPRRNGTTGFYRLGEFNNNTISIQGIRESQDAATPRLK